jgi:hypothetical protein
MRATVPARSLVALAPPAPEELELELDEELVDAVDPLELATELDAVDELDPLDELVALALTPTPTFAAAVVGTHDRSPPSHESSRSG